METFEQFVAAINSHDPEALGRLMRRTMFLWMGLETACRGTWP
jgi:hypothetical protein